MANAVAQSFLDLVRRSQLVEEDQLASFLAGYSGGQLPERQEAIAEGMVEAGLITQWQSEKLLAGKHRGFILGKYKLLGQLGRGGMSTVYLAEHILMRARRAIKVLPKNKVQDSTYLERFRIEARAAAKLDDPNIVRAYDIDQEGDTHFLVMEYVDGQDLHLHVKEHGPLDFFTAADYIAQVASGLDHAHDMGLVHRDIKPANCLLDHAGTVKLLDMGLARLIDDEASLTLDNNENVLGTADYLAPEQALNSHNADKRADIYSLGCTLYFLLTGHPPFPEGSISERLMKHQMESAPSILKDRPDVPSTLLHVCEKMMAKDPDDRYQTAGDVAERLRDWLADHGREPGESGKREEPSSGVGSDVFRRFAQSIGRPNGDSSETQENKNKKKQTKPRRQEPEVELGLAPLDEEKEPEQADDTPSDETSINDRDNLVSTPPEPEEETPHRSLIEEALEKQEAEQARTAARFQTLPGEINPLRPPGYAGPSYGPPAWLLPVALLSGLALVGIVLALIFG